MSHRARRLSTLALFLFLTSRSLPALDDWRPITPEDLKMTSEQAGNAHAIVLYHEVTSDDIHKHRMEYKRIKILTEKGKAYADVNIPYGRDGHFGTQIVDVKARTIDSDGKIT